MWGSVTGPGRGASSQARKGHGRRGDFGLGWGTLSTHSTLGTRVRVSLGIILDNDGADLVGLF